MRDFGRMPRSGRHLEDDGRQRPVDRRDFSTSPPRSRSTAGFRSPSALAASTARPSRPRRGRAMSRSFGRTTAAGLSSENPGAGSTPDAESAISEVAARAAAVADRARLSPSIPSAVEREVAAAAIPAEAAGSLDLDAAEPLRGTPSLRCTGRATARPPRSLSLPCRFLPLDAEPTVFSGRFRPRQSDPSC